MNRKDLLLAIGMLSLTFGLFFSLPYSPSEESTYALNKEVIWESTQLIFLEFGSRIYYEIYMSSGDTLSVQFSVESQPVRVEKTGPMVGSILFFIEKDEKTLYSSNYVSVFKGTFVAPSDGEYRVYFQNDLKEQPVEKRVTFKMTIFNQKMVEIEKRVERKSVLLPAIFAISLLTITSLIVILRQ